MCSLTIIYRFYPYKSSCTLKALCELYLRRFLPRSAEMNNSQNSLKPRRAESSRPTVAQMPHLRRCRGWTSLHGKQLPFSKNHIPATRPWVGSVARNTLAIQNSKKASNKTPTATPKPIPAKGAIASGAK